MGTDGSGFGLLHEFTGLADDGGRPYGSLTLDGSTLYGMTRQGGDGDVGTVFSIGTDGGGFSLLRGFAGGASDGADPHGSLTLSGTTLYGMTEDGGDSNYGTIFSMETDGSNFSLLHEFAGGNDDGSWPRGSLALDGTNLYGMTYWGGDSNRGVVFSMAANIPEPTTSTTFALGLLVVAVRRKRRA
jgi:uncharacterized repeat protein (TIGR03803 family)